jgi:hypothetical protein
MAVIALVVNYAILLSGRLMAKHLLPGVSAAPITVECPQCAAFLSYHSALTSRLDASGFECCELECRGCGASIVGMIDPYDGQLLLSLGANFSRGVEGPPMWRLRAARRSGNAAKRR